MIELVFVIVVLGIVAMIATNIIVKMYEGYIRTKAVNELQTKTELVLEQIANRLKYRIKDSIIARKGANDFVALSAANNTYSIMEWIGYDNEGFQGMWDGTDYNTPGWSGFVDIRGDDTNQNEIKTTGSDLTAADAIIGQFTNNVDIGANYEAALIFKGDIGSVENGFGWGTDHNHTKIYRVRQKAGQTDILEFDPVDPNSGRTNAAAPLPASIYEQYHLAWSAYAIVPEGNNTNDFNLTLYYDYQPWLGDDYNASGTQVLLMEHVSTFRFTQIGDTIRMKLCINDDNKSTGGAFNFGFCKEKVVF